MKKVYVVEGWCIPRRVVIALSIAAVVEIGELLWGFPAVFSVGWVHIAWSIFPCLGALALLVQYPRLHHIVVGEPRALAYVALFVLLGIFGGAFVVHNGFGVTAAILVAVGMEEVIYRLALPAVITLCAVCLGARPRVALFLSVGIAIALFAAMPGHREQLHDLRSYLALIAFSVLMSHAVWRGNSLLAAVFAHAVYDYVTLGMQVGDVSSLLRICGAAAALLSLAIIASHPKVQIIDLRDTVTVDRSEEGEEGEASVLHRI